MEKSSKRGKIPQSDWPSIMARYEAGETLSSIARTYDCSPPAISYVVNRSRARQPSNETPRPAPLGETQLIKAAGNAADSAIHREASPTVAPPHPASLQRSPEVPPVHAGSASQAPAPADHRTDVRQPADVRQGDGLERPHGAREQHAPDPFARSHSPAAARLPEPQPSHHATPQAAPNSDQRGRLHLQLGNGSHGNGAAPNEPRHAEQPQAPVPQQQAPNGGGYRPAWATPASQRHPAPGEPQHHQPAPANYPAPPAQPVAPQNHHPAPLHSNGSHSNPAPRKEGSASFIDSELRARVDADIAAFLAAFDGALAQDTPESRGALREATDRLLRAGARTRIELERLEARMPLPPRDPGRSEPAWRQR